MQWLLLVAVLCVGILIGMLIIKWTEKDWVVGYLREDRSDPDSPYMFMELEHNGLEKIHKYKSVILRVKLENYIQDQ